MPLALCGVGWGVQGSRPIAANGHDVASEGEDDDDDDLDGEEEEEDEERDEGEGGSDWSSDEGEEGKEGGVRRGGPRGVRMPREAAVAGAGGRVRRAALFADEEVGVAPGSDEEEEEEQEDGEEFGVGGALGEEEEGSEDDSEGGWDLRCRDC